MKDRFSSTVTVCDPLPMFFLLPARASEQGNVIGSVRIYVIVINQMRGLYEIYKSRDTRAKPEWQGFMNRVQTERWFITIL